MSGTLLGAFAGTVLFFRDSKPYHKFVDHIGMPLLRILDAETAHNAAVWAAANKLAPLVGTLRFDDLLGSLLTLRLLRSTGLQRR